MLIETTLDVYTMETVLRIGVNAYTATGTITGRTIAIGSPVILATNTASLPTTASNTSQPLYPSTNVQNFITNPATKTSLVNNLLVGLLVAKPGTSTVAYLEAEEQGLVQCYGPYVGARVLLDAAISPGNVLIPDSADAGALILGAGPNTSSAATGTAANVESPAIGGLIIAMAAVASSGATYTTTTVAFCRCM